MKFASEVIVSLAVFAPPYRHIPESRGIPPLPQRFTPLCTKTDPTVGVSTIEAVLGLLSQYARKGEVFEMMKSDTAL